jgi:soluble lytic murein transglycosylase-like protein
MKRMITAVIIVILLFAGFALIANAGSDHQGDWKEYIERLCEDKDILPELVEAMIEKESSWNPAAVNGNCVGLMQVNKEIHKELIGDLDMTDPYDNIYVGVTILEELLHKYGEAAPALMFYNAGYSDNYGVGAYEDEKLSNYADEILKRAEELERMHGK